MKVSGAGRYTLEWVVLLLLTLTGAWLVGSRKASPGAATAMVSGALISALVHLPAYFALGFGLWRKPEKFFQMWAIALSVKVGIALLSVAIANWQKFESYRSFLLGVGVAFPIFGLHQICRLVREQGRVTMKDEGTGVGETLA